MTGKTIAVEPLRVRDVPRCAEIEQLLFSEDTPWSEDAFYQELAGDTFYVGAYLADTVIGYAGIGLTQWEADIHTIGVDPAHHRKGVGTRLLRELLAQADHAKIPVFLEVRTDNSAAISLYQAHGFTRIGLRRRYYQPSGADAYTMKRQASHG